MSKEHWFDHLNRVVVQKVTRREAMREASRLLAGLLIGRSAPAAAAQERCARALCRRHFESRNDRDFCEIKCGRCRIRSKFCIVGGTGLDDLERATCCKEDQRCCQDGKQCCPEDSVCCPSTNARPCCPAGESCCASDLGGCCSEHETCCPGRGCTDTASNPNHCGGCNNPCAAGETCVDGSCMVVCPDGWTVCNGVCVDTLWNPNHCGGCNSFNPNGLKCCYGNVCHFINGVCCHSPGARGTCMPEGHPPC
jgi:hypothetical protein